MQQIFDFIAQDNITAASDLLETLERQFENIMLFPNCGFKSKKGSLTNFNEIEKVPKYEMIFEQ
jgi:plasmid stabilization system protein ParE